MNNKITNAVGSVIFCDQSGSTVTIDHSTITENHGQWVMSSYGQFVITSSTIIYNEGGGLNASEITFINSIITNNGGSIIICCFSFL